MTNLLGSPTLIGLVLQSAGVLMISVLCLTLVRTIRRPPLVPWTAAWIALFISLMAQLLALQVPRASALLHPVYMIAEYGFGYLVFAGCREYASGRRVGWPDWPAGLVLLLPAVVVSPVARGHVGAVFSVHAFIYGCLFLVALRQLLRARPSVRSAPGVLVVKVALCLLALSTIVYALMFGLSGAGLMARPLWLQYSSFLDSLLLTMLGFGMIMVATGQVQSDLEVARDRLARVAQTDHLTSAFNRYAFHTLLDRELAGTAVIADIDNLKWINDRHGHSAGDAAIRAVASAIRGGIRADDLLFRWGGDEFLILLLGFSEPDARLRLAKVNDLLRAVPLPGGGATTISVSVSMGFASFDSGQSLDDVIRVADSAMYGTKKRSLANDQDPVGDTSDDR